MGRMFLNARRYEEAEQQLMAALDITPSSLAAHSRLAHIYELTGQYEKAASALQRAWVFGGATEEEVAGLPDAATLGAEGYLRWELDYHKGREVRGAYVRPDLFAMIHSRLGEKDQGFEWLERAFEERSGSLIYINTNARYDPLRDDPRFQDLLP